MLVSGTPLPGRKSIAQGESKRRDFGDGERPLGRTACAADCDGAAPQAATTSNSAACIKRRVIQLSP